MEATEMILVVLAAGIGVVAIFVGGAIFVLKKLGRGIKWMFGKK